MSQLLKPKGFEMQSGPGKHLDEKFAAYSLGSQSSRKFMPTLQLPDILAKIQRKLPPEEVDKLIAEAHTRESSREKSVQHKRATHSWAFSSQSRTEYYAAMQRKDRVPCTGYYTPKFDGVDPNTPVPALKQPKPTPRTRKTGRASEERELEDYLEKGKPCTVFHRQLDRPGPTAMAKDVNEKRFEPLPEPQNYSKNRRIITPILSKLLARHPLQKPHSSPRYSPKFEAVWKKSVPAISFAKVTGRSPDHPSPATHLHYDNICFAQVSPKPLAPNFGSATARPETGALPSHMMKVHHRMSLTVLQESSLLVSSQRTAEVCRSASVGRIV